MKIWLATLSVIALALGIAVYTNHQEVLKLSSRLEGQQTEESSAQVEKCARQAEKVFSGYGYNSKGGDDFRSHYSATLHRCLVEIRSMRNSGRSRMLLDAYERSEYGSFDEMMGNTTPAVMNCVVDTDTTNKKTCKTEDEFNRLTAKYLQN